MKDDLQFIFAPLIAFGKVLGAILVWAFIAGIIILGLCWGFCDIFNLSCGSRL